ncbi:MAG TPA: hypothetical protein VL947_00890, partial [Cytophagales bacterium]|nr:hypothetical protein [Cytophagales bacterium]
MNKYNMCRRLFIGLLIVLTQFNIVSQDNNKNYLLSDVELQLESLDGLQALYNYDFPKAQENFEMLKRKYPKHPIAYYLLGLMQWWKILPNIEDKQYDEYLITYMDSSITFAEEMYKKDNYNIEANFFLAAAHGLKGRIYSDRGNWGKATSAGKSAMTHLSKNKDIDDLGVEFLFGTALYNYYSVWVPEKYPIMKPVMLMFPKGDADQGILQLKDVAFNSFYTRVEAQTHLLSIYLDVESLDRVTDKEKQENNIFCYSLLKNLIQDYPNNPYFARIYAKCCFNLGKINDMVDISKSIIQKYENKVPFYEEQSVRYASFFMGYYHHMYTKDSDEALKYFRLSEQVSETLKAYHMGYYHYSLFYLGQELEKKGDKKGAEDYYKKVKKHAGKNEAVYD